MLKFAESGHPVFRAGAVEREELKSKGQGVKSMHFNGSDETIELILRTVISVNQLSVYGAVADLWKELAMVIPTEFPTANPILRLMRKYNESCCAEIPEQQKLTKLCSNAGFSKIIGKGQFFITFDEEGLDEMKTSCREYTYPEVR